MAEGTDDKEMEWDGHKAIKLLKRLSSSQCVEYLMSGYIKQNSTTQQYDIYPSELKELNIKFLGFKKNFFIRFKSALTDPERLKLLNEHHAIAIKKTTFLIDLPIPVNDDEINIEWTLQIHAPGLQNGHYFIGIVHDKYIDYDTSVWLFTAGRYSHKPLEEQVDIYGVMGNPIILEDGLMEKSSIAWNGLRSIGDILTGKNEGLHEKYCKVGKNCYFNDDVVVCEYNGKLKEFTLRKQKGEDKELICNMRLKEPENEAVKYWYPAISLRDKDDYVLIL